MNKMNKIKKFKPFLESLLPEPAQNEIKKIMFFVPVKVRKDIDDSMFSYWSGIDEIVSNLEREGIDASWLSEQFESWKSYKVDEFEPGEEPMEDDFEDDDDFNAEVEEWEERKEKFDIYTEGDDTDMMDEYVSDEFGNWDKFMEEFKLEDQITILDGREQKEIFDILKDDFNQTDMKQYFDNFELSTMEIVGNNFEDGYFIVEVGTIEDLSEDKIEVLKNWLEGQMSDGWGEGFEQQDINGFSVSPWWNGYDTYLPKYEIKVEK